MRELYYNAEGDLIGGDDSMEENREYWDEEIVETTVVKRRRGRPARKGDSRASVITARFSEEELQMLDYLADESGKSRSDAIRKAVQRCFYMDTNRGFFDNE